MDEFSPPQQQSTLMQNDFSTNRGVTKFKTTLDIENYAIASMHEQMLNSRATVSRVSEDKRIANEFDLSELTTDIPDEYVEAVNSDSDPDFENPKHKKAHRKRSFPLSKNSKPAISRKRSISSVKQSKSSPSSKQKLSGINEKLRANVEQYYSQVQQLKRQVKVQGKQLEYLRSKLTYISEFSNIGPIITHDPMKDE